MEYRAISADGHINEPPTLWVDNLPEKYKERGPRIIETPTARVTPGSWRARAGPR